MKKVNQLVALLLFVVTSTFCLSSTSISNDFSPKGGNITASEFKAQLGLIPWLENFDFEAKCTITSFTLYYTPKREDTMVLKAKKGKFEGKIKEVVRQANSGDSYAFTNVKVKCPGDTYSRSANGLYFQIR